MKKVVIGIIISAILLGGVCAANAASNIYGISGLIETPDDTIGALASVDLTVKSVPSFQSTDTFGGNVGVLPKLEVGALGINNTQTGGSTQALLNAKFKILGESLVYPSVTVGVVDAADRLNHIGLDHDISDPSLFLVVGKNLTGAAEKVAGQSGRAFEAECRRGQRAL